MHRTLKFFAVAVLIPLTALCATGTQWNAARWQALFDGVPAPPATLAQTAGMLTMKRPAADIEGVATPTAPALMKSRADFHAGMAAQNAQTLAGADGAAAMASANSAEALASRMQHASQDQRMAMAMQYAMQMQASQPAAFNREGAQAAAGAAAYAQAQEPKISQALSSLQQAIETLRAENAARHKAADAVLIAAYRHCPRPARCGDSTDCSPDAGCVAAVNARLPALIAQHRRIAQAELTAERAAWLKARDTIQPILAHLAALLATAEKAGSPGQERMTGYTRFLGAAGKLQIMDALVTMRAAFWQGIQPKPLKPDYFNFSIPSDYHFVSGKDELTAPPDTVPKGW